ncbi:glycosyltransferase [Aquamicrobium sp. LC103]|uniref:glycosyltransferase n=1 Tax=Aquamicrobium sp. LC103 TaxID=1120658 RepID=UPI00069A4C9E|nr:glycosyltransferase [Aquamicrobium sp. LC103]
MRLLVYPHDLSIGGSQINAIDLAAAVAAAGHEVAVYGIPGPLVSYIEERGLRFVPARRLRYRPAPSRIAQLAAVAARERIDLIHAYEWPSCLDAYYGAAAVLRVPLLCTVLSMSVMPQVPASVPLVMGTADLGDEARAAHRGAVWVLEPPIDVERDHPGIDGEPFRRRHNVAPDEFLIVAVSRLALDLKLDALVRAVDAADLLAARRRIRLILVGDGPSREALDVRARAVNARWSREVVTLAGAELDPRGAYAAADLVLGMGSSALRALAIGRPLIVQGERAFSEIFERETLGIFLRQGFYGLANDERGAARLAGQVDTLIDDPSRRDENAAFGRELVVRRFSLERAVDIQLGIYRKLLATSPAIRPREALRSAWLALKIEIDNHDPRRKRRLRRREDRIFDSTRAGFWPPSFEGL